MKAGLVVGFIMVVMLASLAAVASPQALAGETRWVSTRIDDREASIMGLFPVTSGATWVSIKVYNYFTSVDNYLVQSSKVLLLASKVVVYGNVEWQLSVEPIGQIGDYPATHFLRVVFLSPSLAEMGTSITGYGHEEIWTNYLLQNLKDLPKACFGSTDSIPPFVFWWICPRNGEGCCPSYGSVIIRYTITTP